MSPAIRMLRTTLIASALVGTLPTLAAEVPPQAYMATQPGAEPTWTLNLKDADIRTFIDQVSQITEQTFVVDPRVRGQVSVISSTALTLPELYQLFLSVMAAHGYSVLDQDDIVSIVPNAEARSEAGRGPAGGAQLETRVLQAQQASVSELIPLIRPLVPQYGHLAAVPSANAFIITDRSANIARIEQLLEQLDSSEAHEYSVLPLQYGWALDISDVLQASILSGDSKAATSTRILADSRTNRLVFIGPSKVRESLMELARTLDAPSIRSANARVIRLRFGDAKSMAETLGEISEGLTAQQGESTATGTSNRRSDILIRADEGLNALVILAEPDMIDTLEDIVRQLDVPRAQVLVEAAIVELSGDISDALGVQWTLDSSGSNAVGGVSFSTAGNTIGTLVSAINEDSVPSVLSDGATLGLGSRSFGMLVTALSSNSKSNLLSTPSLLTLDNSEAEILVGQEVPFETGSYTTDTDGSSNPFTTIERQDIGVTLKVTPHINEGATLRLEIEQEISALSPSSTVASGAVDLITSKRSIKSSVLADDGQIIVLGGLIQDDITKTVSKVPLLGDIPWLGALFRSTEDAHVKRNLMVFLRPSIVRDRAGLDVLSGKKYSDIQLIETDPASPTRLPRDPQKLFDGRSGRNSLIDLRQESSGH